MGMDAVAVAPRAIRVAIVDDTEDLRFLLRVALERDGMDVVGEAGDGAEGVALCRAEQPDVVLLDLAMPVMDGREALPLIRREVPAARIIVLSGFGADLMSTELMQLGADGYIEKGHSVRSIVDYVEQAAATPPASKPTTPVLRLVRDTPPAG